MGGKQLSYGFLDKPRNQFVIGLFFNLILFAILVFSSPESFRNIQIPEGEYSDNIQVCSDVMSYVKPARNFLAYGTFGEQNKPDHFRTIGYPAFLALVMKVFGRNWLYATYFISCLLFALIYPMLTYITSSFFKNELVTRSVFLFSLLSGVYMVKAIYIGTDVFFFFLFITGIYFAVKFVKIRSIKYLILYVVFISLAAQVRPTLSLFFIINLFLFSFLQKVVFATGNTLTIRQIAFTSAILLVTCNLPSIRNYKNYGFFKQSSILNDILFEYTTKKILTDQHKIAVYDSLDNKIQAVLNINEKMNVESEVAVQAIKTYPLTAAKVMFIENAQNVLFDNHLTNCIANYYGYNWKDVQPFKFRDCDCHGYKKTNFLHIAYYIMTCIYIVIYGFFFMYLVGLIRNCEWGKFFFMLLFVSMFLLPTLIGGSGGARFRIDVEWLIVIFSLHQFFKVLKKEDV